MTTEDQCLHAIKSIEDIVSGTQWSYNVLRAVIRREIAAAVQAEREACAKIADEHTRRWKMTSSRGDEANDIASDIRARSNPEAK